MAVLTIATELIEIKCRCGATSDTQVQDGAAYHNRCHRCGFITVGFAGKRPVISPAIQPTSSRIADYT